MWIRSQDKEILMKVDNINLGPNRLFTFVGGVTTSFTLGTYKSKERALEVLDEIQEYMIKSAVAKVVSGEKEDFVVNPVSVYQMPKE